MKLSVQEAAERDILRQFEWYAERGLADVAQRFRLAVKFGVDELLATPQAGAPKSVVNIELEGLRTWSVRDFEEFRIYYLVRDDLIKVLRILHGRRDIASILEGETIEQTRGREHL